MTMPSLSELNTFYPSYTHKWVVHIEGLQVGGLPSGYLPCTSVDENVGGISLKSFTVGLEEHFVPHKYNRPSINITYIDDEFYSISKFFNKWCYELFDVKTGMIGDISKKAKLLTISKFDLNNDMNEDISSQYYVLPTQGSNFIGGNNPQFLTSSMSFNVVRIEKSSTLKPPPEE